MYEYKNIEDLTESEIEELCFFDNKLCYVERDDDKYDADEEITHYGYRLYFTPTRMTDQWGDDWDDAPYEHNAGTPCDDYYNEKNERKETTITVLQLWVKAEDWLLLPCDITYCSPWSVADINSGAVAWLFKPSEDKKCNGIAVMAGMSPQEVMWRIGHLSVKP